MQISVDFETYSECDIKTAGGYNYAAHPTTEVLCMAWAIDDEEPKLWVPTDSFPRRLAVAIESGAELWAWNAAFERAVWQHQMLPKHKAPVINPDQWNDTAALAATLALPRALGKCAEVLGVAEQKDKRGSVLIRRVCQPYRGERRRDQNLLNELYDYCVQDVKTERDVKRHLTPYKPMRRKERAIWLLDQKINWRGLGIDTYNVANAIALIYATANTLNAKVAEITRGVLPDCASRARVMAWARERGYELKGYDKAAVIAALADDKLPDDVRQVLEIRQTMGKASTSKYQSMQNLAGADGRARGVFFYHGAQTGRWAGRGFQPQNLPRPAFSDTDNCIKLFEHRDPEILDILYDNSMVALSSCLRGMIVPAEGKRFLVSDYSAIEARVLAWLADEQGPLDVFKSGECIYCHAATGIYGRPITKGDKDERQIGKVAILALGYGGGIGAFQTMAKAYQVKVADEEADAIKFAWREKNPKIVEWWALLEEAARNAVRQPGTKFPAGPVSFKLDGDFLFASLPSGRRLAYYKPSIKNGRLEYWATDSRLGGRWAQLDTYGGKLAENITQAVARDLLAEAMLRLEENGYEVVASIHDEIICEMPQGQGTLTEMEKLMCVLPDWAEGLPLTAEGFECERYRK